MHSTHHGAISSDTFHEMTSNRYTHNKISSNLVVVAFSSQLYTYIESIALLKLLCSLIDYRRKYILLNKLRL